MAANEKDTIYVDIDDEITGIIDKVRNSSSKIVALVLPKRATVFQSIVNMKLLKRSADEAKKHIVLITSEAGLMPLAATVGLYVAKTPQSKPEIPQLAQTDDDEIFDAEDPVSVDGPEEVTAKNSGNRPVGELASRMAGGMATAAAADEVETLDLDNEEDEPSEGEEGAAAAAEAKPSKNKKLHIPNFNKFRVRLVLGVLVLILLIVGFYLANSVLPKASITLNTDTSSIDSNQTISLDTTAKTLDPTQLIVPAQSQQVQKSSSQQVNTTGQKNNGQTATGSITLTTCATSPGQTSAVPAGTGVSSNGLTYITQQDATFSYAGFCNGGSSFKFDSGNVNIAAQSAGAKYNISNQDFTVSGRTGVSGTGSASGGTDNIIKVVAQADIDSATQKIAAQDTSTIKQQLVQQLTQAGLYPVPITFAAGTPATTTSANVGDQADTVTVTESITYTMFGVKQSDLKTIVDSSVKDQIDPSKQVILDEGLGNASFKLLTASPTAAQVQMYTTATAGPDLKTADVKKQVAGKKSGEIQTLLGSNPGVTSVKVHFSPFWVDTAPKNTSKITVIFNKTNTTTKKANASTP